MRSKVVAINKRSKEMHSLVKVQPDNGEEKGVVIEDIKSWRITGVNTSTTALVDTGTGTARKKKKPSAVKKKVAGTN